MKTLDYETREEIKRIERDVIPAYKEIGQGSKFKIMLINIDIGKAEEAMQAGDVSDLWDALQTLRGIK